MNQPLARRGWRQIALLGSVLLVSCLLADRLYSLQVGVGAQQRARLGEYYAADVAVPQTEKPPRGTIVDVAGRPLVSTLTVYKLAVSPYYVPKAKKPAAARILADELFPLRLPTGKLARDRAAISRAKDAYTAHYQQILVQLDGTPGYMCIAGDDSDTCPYRQNVTQDVLNTILKRMQAIGVSGFITEERSMPLYPNGPLASQILGIFPKSVGGGAAGDGGTLA